MQPFKLERFFARHEFKVKYMLSPSDCESLSLSELLPMAAPDSLKLWNELKFGYTESAGHPLLRAEISRMYQGIRPDNTIIAAPEEAIFIVMSTLLRPGDHVIVLAPAYQSLHEIARTLGCRVTPWTLNPGENGWQLDLDRLEQSIREEPRLLVINFPHNPTGFLPAPDQWYAILEMASKHGVTIFSDEMYRMLEYEPVHRLPAVCDLYEKGISLSGLSKSFALPGLRLGWLATQEQTLLEQWLTFKDYTTICNSAPSEILGLIALQAKEKILSRNLEIIRKNLDLAQHFFSSRLDKFNWIPPLAGSVAFPRWRGTLEIDRICQEMLEQQGVLVLPGTVFDFPGNHFRIGLGRRNFPEALARFSDYLESDRIC